MERGREQRLGDRIVQVAGDSLSFEGGTLTLAALRLGQLQRGPPALADDRRQTARRQRREDDVQLKVQGAVGRRVLDEGPYLA
jgi:hypothetical protein